MKMNLTIAAAIIQGLSSGTLRFAPHATDRNRRHRERAQPGSVEEAARITVAETRRRQRAAKRAALAAAETEVKP